MAKKPANKPPEEIRYLLNLNGWNFAKIDRAYGLPAGVACLAARYPHPEGEIAIAKTLGVSTRVLWPNRYDPKTGSRLKPQPRTNYRPDHVSRHCLKGRAA